MVGFCFFFNNAIVIAYSKLKATIGAAQSIILWLLVNERKITAGGSSGHCSLPVRNNTVTTYLCTFVAREQD